MEQDCCSRRFLFSQRPASVGRVGKNQGHQGSWTGPLVGGPIFGKAAPERTTLGCYSALQRTAANELGGALASSLQGGVCGFAQKKLVLLGIVVVPFFRGSFGDGGADLGTGTSATAVVGGAVGAAGRRAGPSLAVGPCNVCLETQPAHWPSGPIGRRQFGQAATSVVRDC